MYKLIKKLMQEEQKKKHAENERKFQQETPTPQQMSEQVSQETQRAKSERQAARQEGRNYAEELLSRDVEGLTPAKRNALQYEANKNIKRAEQAANRRLLGDQSRHGIVGRGGVGYAQQRDLQRLANEARGQSQRDLDKLNSDLALKKLAAMFNIEQGEASQAALDRQAAVDQLNLNEERRKQKYYEDQFNRLLFSRV